MFWECVSENFFDKSLFTARVSVRGHRIGPVCVYVSLSVWVCETFVVHYLNGTLCTLSSHTPPSSGGNVINPICYKCVCVNPWLNDYQAKTTVHEGDVANAGGMWILSSRLADLKKEAY